MVRRREKVRGSSFFPDSVYQAHKYMHIYVPTGNKKTLHIILLHQISSKGDTIRVNVFSVSPNLKYSATFEHTNTVKNFDFYGGKDVTFDDFIVSTKKKSDFSLYGDFLLQRFTDKNRYC